MRQSTDPPATPRSAVQDKGAARCEPGGAGARAAQREHLARVARLLGDDSQMVRAALRRELSSAGRAGRAVLSRSARSADARTRSHARGLLLELRREELVRRLVRHVVRPELELEPALFLLARFEDPGLDLRPYRRALDAMGAEVARRARRRESPLERGRVLVEYLGNELGYGGELEDYHHPDHVHLHRVIERKQGLPLTLVALYLFVARRAGVRAGPLPLPGHAMLRLYGREQSQIVDPFQHGETRSQSALMSYLAKNRLAFQPSWFREAEDRLLLRRQVGNLVNALATHGQRREAAMLRPLARLLARRT